jgi:RHS repeat-associated protein
VVGSHSASGAENPNKYQYNGKELNQDFGLDWNDYGARFYDPTVSRWWNNDPLSEKAKGYSPYTYVFDNPVRFRDPDGRQAEDHILYNSAGRIVGIIPTGTTNANGNYVNNQDRFYLVTPVAGGNTVTLTSVRNVQPVASPQWNTLTAKQKLNTVQGVAGKHLVDGNGNVAGAPRVLNPDPAPAAGSPAALSNPGIVSVNNATTVGGIAGNIGGYIGVYDGHVTSNASPSPNPLDTPLYITPAPTTTTTLNSLPINGTTQTPLSPAELPTITPAPPVVGPNTLTPTQQKAVRNGQTSN